MSYWFEREGLRVGKERDRRRKLTDEEIQLIKDLYRMGFSIRAITRIIGKVDRNAIKWHLFPERHKKEYERRKEKGWYYDRERHRMAMRRYRQHLKQIYGLKNPKKGLKK